MKKWIVIVLALLYLSFFFLLKVWKGIDPVVRNNTMIALMAHARMDNAPEADIDYRWSVFSLWDFWTNSRFLADYAHIIIPQIVYEDGAVPPGQYPVLLIFCPFKMGDFAVYVLGVFQGDVNQICVSERLIFDKANFDSADVLSVLVHELVHQQGGAYTGAGFPFIAESRTAAATTEVLAGMCNQGDKLACHAFWTDIYDFAYHTAWWRANKLGYDKSFLKITHLLGLGYQDRPLLGKLRRDYTEVEWSFYEQYVAAWAHNIVPGVAWDEPLHTGQCDVQKYEITCYRLDFDDTRYLLGERLTSWLREAYPLEEP